MKKPVLFLSMLFVLILFSTVVVSTTISGIYRSFYKSEMQQNVNGKATPADKELKDDFKQASLVSSK